MEVMLSLLVLRAREPERLAQFYATLGLAFEKHRHGSGPEHFAAVIADRLVLEVYPCKEEDTGTGGLRIGFEVESVKETFAILLAAGGKAVVEPKTSDWGLRAVVDDPQGHRIELTERKSECATRQGAA